MAKIDLHGLEMTTSAMPMFDRRRSAELSRLAYFLPPEFTRRQFTAAGRAAGLSPEQIAACSREAEGLGILARLN